MTQVCNIPFISIVTIKRKKIWAVITLGDFLPTRTATLLIDSPSFTLTLRNLLIVSLLWTVLSTLSLPAQALAEDDLLLINGKFVDPQTRSITSTNFYIHNGGIAKHNGEPAKTLDLHGKWIIPALIDLHVHCHGNPLPDHSWEKFSPHDTAKIMLYSGVCAYLELGYGDFPALFAARDGQRAEPAKFDNEADIYCAGGVFGRWNITAASAPSRIKAYVEKWKPDVIKLIYGRDTLDCQTLTAAIKECSQLGTKTVVHIGSWEHAQDAIKAHATAVTHFYDDEVIPKEVVKVWGNSKTVSIPTMAVQCDMANFINHPALLKSPLLTEIESEKSLKTYAAPKHFSKTARETIKWQNEDRKNEFASFRKLSAAGVRFLAGSDTGNLGTFQGFSTHRDIKLMQDAGGSSWSALAAGTTDAAQFLGRPSGTASGETAELVVLDADPIADIANTQKIFAVIHHGKLVDRNSLRAEIQD